MSFRTFEGTKFAPFNERIAFETAYKNYLANSGKPYPPIPMIGGTILDVFYLFHAVIADGGVEQVRTYP